QDLPSCPLLSWRLGAGLHAGDGIVADELVRLSKSDRYIRRHSRAGLLRYEERSVRREKQCAVLIEQGAAEHDRSSKVEIGDGLVRVRRVGAPGPLQFGTWRRRQPEGVDIAP